MKLSFSRDQVREFFATQLNKTKQNGFTKTLFLVFQSCYCRDLISDISFELISLIREMHTQLGSLWKVQSLVSKSIERLAMITRDTNSYFHLNDGQTESRSETATHLFRVPI